MRNQHFVRVKGIGILELMLVIALMAGIVMVAVRYYESANASQVLNDAADQVSAVRSGVTNYHNDYPNSATLPNIQTLVNTGYLPATFGSGQTANPWGGPINVGSIPTSKPSGGGSGGSSEGGANTTCVAATVNVQPGFSVCVGDIPTLDICQQLSSRLSTTLSPAMNEKATCGSGSASGGSGSATATLTVYYLL